MSYDRIIRDALRLARAPRRFASGGGIDPNDISPSISNPVSVFPKPQRMFPSDAPIPGGQYLGMPDKQDMTGHKSAAASIGVHPGGKPYFNASRDAVDQTGTAGKAKVKTNLFKQKAGWSWQAAPEGHEDTSTIVSVEHRGKHYYTLNAHFPKGVDFARYAESRSEPRLRPTTTGDVFLGPQAGTISVRGKQHPVYHHVVVKADGGAVGYASGGDTTPPRQLNDMGFYSSAVESARSLPQSKGTPQQMLATMKGVKPAELEWSGVQDKFAGQKSVTKDDLAQHFEQNVPEIKETVLGGKKEKNNMPTSQEVRNEYEPKLLHYNDIDEKYNSMIEDGKGHLLTEKDHEEYQHALSEMDRLTMEMDEKLEEIEGNEYDNTKYSEYTVGNRYGNSYPSQRNYREVLLHLPGEKKFMSAHWDPANIVTHLRMQDRGLDNDILHLEELQSDWAQKGRDGGFGTPTNGYNVQPAPYVTNTDHWMELGLKRALLEAARGGYNKLVWTPGEEQAKRYDLSNHIKDMYYDPDTQHLEYTKVDGKSKIHPSPVSLEDLPKLIGRELADRLLSSKPDYGENSHYLGGLNLKIGGEGMKSFYDKMLPAALRRVLKPHTDKIQPTSHVVKGNDGEDVTLPGIEITPEMRESILKKGFSYYARGGEVRQHFEVGGGADSGSDSGGGFEGSGGGGDSAPEATQDSPAFSTEAPPSYSPPESDPSMLGGATGMAFSPSGSGSLGVGTGNTSGSFLGAAEQQLNTGPGIVGLLGGTPMGLMALGAEKLNEAARAHGYDVVDPGGARPGRGTEQAAREQAAYEAGFPGNRAGGNDSGMIPDPVAPEPSFYGFRLSNDDEETQAGMVRPVGFTPPKPPMMAHGGVPRNSHPALSIPGVHIREEIHGRPIFLGERDG